MKINVSSMLGYDTLRHRDTAQILVNKIIRTPNKEKITLDFSGISFASRSFCHELITGLENRDICFVNLEPEVEEMLNLVRKKIKPKVKLKESYEIKKIEKVLA
jgi:anti-anti-sigma regulatory factor